MRKLGLCVAVVALLVSTDLPAQTLETRIKPLIEAHRGEVAIAIKHLGTGDEFRHNADQVMPTASLIKVAVMLMAPGGRTPSPGRTSGLGLPMPMPCWATADVTRRADRSREMDPVCMGLSP